MFAQSAGGADTNSMTETASSAGLSSEHHHEQDLAGFETTQDLTSTGHSAASSVSPQVKVWSMLPPRIVC